MKEMGTMLMGAEPFAEIVMGNTALVRAMVESGVAVATSYPGSPTPEIATAINSIPGEKRPFYFEFSVNEKVATEVAFGAAVNGNLSVVFFKSVGLNVAADSFVQLPLMEIIGGMVVVIGDDPGAHSSQNEQDNRHYARLSYMPLYEPANPREVYGMFLDAATQARRLKMPVLFRMTTHVCHAKAKVNFGNYSRKVPDRTPHFSLENGPYIPIAAEVFQLKRKALAKLREFAKISESSPFNLIEGKDSREGIITFSTSYLAVKDVLQQARRTPPDILKIGLSYPLPKEKIARFISSRERVLVLEELDPVAETEIKALCFEKGLKAIVLGKSDPEDQVGEMTPDRVYEKLARDFPGLLPERAEKAALPSVPARPPQMCPGCGHRSAFHAVKRALAKDDISVADIGCHSLGFLPPYRMGEVLLSMGHSTSTASGLSLFNSKRRVVAFIGDSTFFHAGLPGIINSLFNKHNVTLIVMENGTTAMTGHQEHPATGLNFNGPTAAIPLRRVLEALGVSNIREVDTYSQGKLSAMVQEALAEEGFKVIIARHPCMLKLTREQRKKGQYRGNKVQVAQEKCTRAHECVAVFACPTFQIDEHGTVRTSAELCIGDGSCLQTCPSKALVFGKGE